MTNILNKLNYLAYSTFKYKKSKLLKSLLAVTIHIFLEWKKIPQMFVCLDIQTPLKTSQDQFEEHVDDRRLQKRKESLI